MGTNMDALQQVRRVPKYIFDLVAWLWRTRLLVWVLMAIVVVLVLGVLISSCLERYVRVSGMGLQLIGVIVVGIGLRDTRRAFEDQPTTWEGIKQWWAGRPRFRPRHITLEARGVAIGVAGMSARARVTAGPNTSLEQRVAILERGHAALFDEVGKLGDEIKQKIGELSNAMTLERSERQEADKGVKEQLKKAVAEGLPLGRVGAVCFFIGIIAASASPEIASLFGGSTCQSESEVKQKSSHFRPTLRSLGAAGLNSKGIFWS